MAADGAFVRRQWEIDRARSMTVVSFFSGCGGLDLGFLGGFEFLEKKYSRHGFRISAAYDVDAASIETYKRNIGPHAHVMDLSTASIGGLPSADILLGGFPCQEFSNCGPRKGVDSPRGGLYRLMVAYALAHQPRVVVAENVAGLLSMNNGEDCQKIIYDFERAGYRGLVWEFRAENYGVPQRRHRVFLIFVRSDLPFDPSKPGASKSQHVSVKEAISDLQNAAEGSVPNQDQYFKAAKARNGHGQGDEVSPADSPGYTVRANSRSRVQFHYQLSRRLTVRECARLQTFPDAFAFPFSATVNMRMIGNAVPPVLAHSVAKTLSSYVKSCDRQGGGGR